MSAKRLEKAKLPIESIQLVPTKDRAAVQSLLKMTDYIDVIVPRGGKSLVGLVQAEARVPVFAISKVLYTFILIRLQIQKKQLM